LKVMRSPNKNEQSMTKLNRRHLLAAGGASLALTSATSAVAQGARPARGGLVYSNTYALSPGVYADDPGDGGGPKDKTPVVMLAESLHTRPPEADRQERALPARQHEYTGSRWWVCHPGCCWNAPT